MKSLLIKLRRCRRRNKRSKKAPTESCASRTAVFDAFGLLEHVFGYVNVPDLLVAAAVDRRWKEAARNDLLWQEVAWRLWNNKYGMPRDEGALFRKTLYSSAAIDRMTKAQLVSLQSVDELERVGIDHEDELSMRRCVKNHVLAFITADSEAPPCPVVFQDIWFGSYVASLVDSRRAYMTKKEMCSIGGFDLHPKKGIYLTHTVPIVYFEESGRFSWQDMFDEGTYPANAETWKWLDDARRRVQVGSYAPLKVTRRRDDWGWTFENKHVRLVIREC